MIIKWDKLCMLSSHTCTYTVYLTHYFGPYTRVCVNFRRVEVSSGNPWAYPWWLLPTLHPDCYLFNWLYPLGIDPLEGKFGLIGSSLPSGGSLVKYPMR